MPSEMVERVTICADLQGHVWAARDGVCYVADMHGSWLVGALIVLAIIGGFIFAIAVINVVARAAIGRGLNW